MPTYRKKLKRAKDGCFVRYVGSNFGGVAEKFRLGFDLREAEKRESLIIELWEHLEANPNIALHGIVYWTPDFLKAAKAIAKGKEPVFPATFGVKS